MLSGYIDDQATQFQTQDRLHAIILSAMDAIITIDDQRRIICFNPAAERMFRLPVSEALGEKIERFIPHRLPTIHDLPIRHAGTTGEASSRLDALSALRADGEEFPVEASISQAYAGNEPLSVVILRDITAREANTKAQALLAREVDHRAKNILAIMSSLVTLTRKGDRETYVASLLGRVEAMSRAHSLLSMARWQGAPLGRVARDELEAHADPDQFSCDGPSLMLSSRAVQPVGMLLHELATNAVKYGALSVPDGHVELRWTARRQGGVSLSWRERGGPSVIAPVAPGFGSTLIQQIIDNQLSGSFRASWNPAGYELLLELPDTVLQANREAQRAAQNHEGSRGDMTRHWETDSAKDQRGGTLLIVEDEPLLAMQLSQSLEAFGWSVLGVAGSIEDANHILATKARPDAAILDVDLAGAPVFPLARSLQRAGIPFIFCSGYEDLSYSREFGDCTAVRKPATIFQIVRALRNVVGAGAGAMTMRSAIPSPAR